MSTLRCIAILGSTVTVLSLAAYGQQTQLPPGRPAPSRDLNTDTNSQPDMTGTSGHPDTDVRIRPGVGTLVSAMANFSVRTGIEIQSNTYAQVVVRSVRPATPAARAGVDVGDVIVRVDGTEVPTIGDFQNLLIKRPSKPAFLLSLKRGDQPFAVSLGRQFALLGMTLFPDRADRPIVSAIDPKSPAAYAGFEVGDMIVGFGHQPNATMSGVLDFGIPFVRSVQEGRGIPFDVVRNGRKMKLSVTRPTDADLSLLSPEQERRLRNLAKGAEARPQERPGSIKTTTTRTTSANPTAAPK